jgi:putative membrane protein
MRELLATGMLVATCSHAFAASRGWNATRSHRNQTQEQIMHFNTKNSRTRAVLFAGLFALASCGKKADVAADSATARAMAPADSAAMAPPAAPALTDANIVYILDQANASDSARGALAATKGTNAEVKSFGRLMSGEHHALRQEGRTLATKLGVAPTAPANDMSEMDAKAEMDKMTAETKGAGFDRSYIDYEVTYHRAVLDIANKALGAAQNQELKDLITKAAPVIQKHLDRAVAIQAKMQAM